jgi:hypothetical protein
MAKKRKDDPGQPDLPLQPAANGNGRAAKTKPARNGNGETHVLAESVATPVPHLFKPGKIDLPLHRRMDRNFLDYASYVIRDRAIPNLADGASSSRWPMSSVTRCNFIPTATLRLRNHWWCWPTSVT